MSKPSRRSPKRGPAKVAVWMKTETTDRFVHLRRTHRRPGKRLPRPGARQVHVPVNADALVYIDMSEYMEKHNVSPSDRGSSRIRRLRRGGQNSPRKSAVVPSPSSCSTKSKRQHPGRLHMPAQVHGRRPLTDSFGRQRSIFRTRF